MKTKHGAAIRDFGQREFLTIRRELIIKNSENKNTWKTGTVVSQFIFDFALIAWFFYSDYAPKHFIVGEKALAVRAAVLFVYVIVCVIMLVISIVTFVKRRRKFYRKSEIGILAVIIVYSSLSLFLIHSQASAYFKDLTSGSLSLTTDLYSERIGSDRFYLSDGTEERYFCIDEELAYYINNNTSVSTDEDYIQKRLDEQTAALKFRPHNESVRVEYYPDTEIIKSIEVLESGGN